MQLNDQPLVLGDDYIPSARPAAIVAAPVVFAGNGWFVKSKDIDAYKDLDAKGKIAVIFGPANAYPRGIKSSDLTGKRGEDWMNAAEYAQKQGVVGMVVIPDFQYLANWDRNRSRVTERGVMRVDKFQPAAAAQVPQIVISPRVAKFLFQGERQSAQSLFESIYASQTPEPFALNPDKKLSIAVKSEIRQRDYAKRRGSV